MYSACKQVKSLITKERTPTRCMEVTTFGKSFHLKQRLSKRNQDRKKKYKKGKDNVMKV